MITLYFTMAAIYAAAFTVGLMLLSDDTNGGVFKNFFLSIVFGTVFGLLWPMTTFMSFLDAAEGGLW